MARKDNEQKTNTRALGRLSSFIQDNLDKLYTSTYYTTPSNKHDLDHIKSKLDDSIDNIVTSNINNIGKGSLSALYSRMQNFTPNNSSNSGTNRRNASDKSLEELLNDNAILESGLLGFIDDTTSIYDYDNKIDTIIKYMPRLQEAMDCRKDNVLSADHFSKEFINVSCDNVTDNTASYDEHIKNVKKTYAFQEKSDEIYDRVAKYGEAFVYVVPAKKAISRLIRNKNGQSLKGNMNIQESCIISENGKFEMESIPEGVTEEDFIKNKLDGIQVECDMSGMIGSVVKNYMRYGDAVKSLNEMSLNCENTDMSTDSLNEAVTDIRSALKGRFEKTLKDDLSFENFDDKNGLSQDGFINKGDKRKNKKNETIDIPGSIFKILPRKQVIPLYIEEHCFGYYYIETEGPYSSIKDYDKMQDPTMSMKGSNTLLSSNSLTDQSQKQNKILRYLSNQISSFIDANFVNTNQDLRNEIYMVLKYNYDHNCNTDRIRVTFIPPDDIEHVYFKMDKETHRGISDLDKALFPATLYSSMYITNCIWTMTRSQDKRVYYVNSSVDTNISKVLLNTINQIKKGNMNIRQIDNINHILNITGKFNDYIIPRNSSGQAPVDFEVMQGQQIEFKTELMNVLEEMAINSTDVPMEMIQMRQSVEYATQLSMSSSKFLRKVYNRQAKYQENLTRIFNKLYNNEYDDNISLTIKLPPPMFLNITNTNQMMTNVNEYSNSVAQVLLDPSESEEVKNAVIREINRQHLGSYLNMDELEEMVKKAKHETSKNIESSDNEEE